MLIFVNTMFGVIGDFFFDLTYTEITRSTVEREPLSSEYVIETDYYYDGLDQSVKDAKI